MDEQMIALGRRAVACKGWRWMPKLVSGGVWTKYAQDARGTFLLMPFGATLWGSTDATLSVEGAKRSAAEQKRARPSVPHPTSGTGRAVRVAKHRPEPRRSTGRVRKAEPQIVPTTKSDVGTCCARQQSITPCSRAGCREHRTWSVAAATAVSVPARTSGTTTRITQRGG